MKGNQVRCFVNNTSVLSWNIQRCYSAASDVNNLKSWKEIPGPKSYPLIGQVPHFLPRGMFHKIKGIELFDKMYKHFGPIVRLDGLLGRPPIVMIIDAKSSAQILRGENWIPARPGFESLEYYRKKLKKGSSGPTGLLTEQGEEWKKFRSAVNPVLLQPKTIKLYESSIEEVANEMIMRMKSKRDKNDQIDGNLYTEINLWALESIGVVALGGRLNCLKSDLPEDSPAKQLIRCVHDIFKLSNELDFGLSFWRYFPTKTFKKAMHIYDLQDRLSKQFISESIKQKKHLKSENEKGVLEKLMEIDENVAYIMASDMLFAGVDTTATAMITTFYLLAINPEKQEKLREEIKKKEDNKYLKACLKESLRMMPVVSGNFRQITKEYHVLGYRLPKDMHVSFAHQYLSMMEEQYPRPEEYIPERWIVSKDDPLYHGNADTLAYSPFGFGARACIGKRIADLEMETFLKKILENFRIEWFGGKLQTVNTSLNYVQGPFDFQFRDL